MSEDDNKDMAAPDASALISFELFIDSREETSILASKRIKSLLDHHLSDKYTLTIYDLLSDVAAFEQAHVIAVPTFIYQDSFGQKQRIIGASDMAESLIVTLGMRREAKDMSNILHEFKSKYE